MFKSSAKLITFFTAAILVCSAVTASANNLRTTNQSNNGLNNWSAMRGFDPLTITTNRARGANQAFIDTYLTDSTQFGLGAGMTAGSSDFTLCQMRVDCSYNQNGSAFVEGGSATVGAMPDPVSQTGNANYFYTNYVADGDDGLGNPLFTQAMQNDAISFALDAIDPCDTLAVNASQARCTELDFGVIQNETTGGGEFSQFFTVDALQDDTGAQLGDAQVTFTRTFGLEGLQSPTLTTECGTGHYNATNGWVEDSFSTTCP